MVQAPHLDLHIAPSIGTHNLEVMHETVGQSHGDREDSWW
jgi:hypothetical protein